MLNKKLDEKFLISLDQDGSGIVSEFEYVSAMLVLLEYVEQDDIDRVMKAFRKLDVDGSGSLTVEDLASTLTNKVEFIRKNLCKPKKVFKDCDTNGNGSLEPNEVRAALHALGCPMSDEDFDAMFQTLDKDNDGSLSFNEFKKVLYQRIVFSAIDDVSGSLDRDEVFESFEAMLNISLTNEELDRVYKEMARTDDTVTFQEFKQFFDGGVQKQKEKILMGRKRGAVGGADEQTAGTKMPTTTLL